MTDEELLEDAEAIGGLEPTGEAVPDRKSRIHTLRFPAQQYKLARATHRRILRQGRSPGRSSRSDESAGTLELRRGPSFEDVPLPRALIPGGPYGHRAAASGARASRVVGARRRWPLSGAARHPRATPPRIARLAMRGLEHSDHRPCRAAGADRRARCQLSLHPGAARARARRGPARGSSPSSCAAAGASA